MTDYDDKVPGSFRFVGYDGGVTAIWIVIPNGVGPIHIPLSGPKAWQWDGNREAPTLSPSIDVKADDHQPGWHGYMRNGKLVSV